MSAPTPLAERGDHSVAREWHEGAGVVSSWADVVNGHGDPQQSVLGHTANWAAAGLDTLGAAMNPLGGLAAAGVGWLIEHVWFLHEPLDALAGDPVQIQDEAKVWQSIAIRMRETADAHRESLGQVGDWAGVAGDAYRSAAQAYTTALHVQAGYAEEAAGQLLDSGVTVATVRALIRDSIAEFIGNIVGALLAAGIAAIFTAGGSVAAWVAWVVRSAVAQAAEIVQSISELVARLSARATELSRLVGRFDELSGALARRADQLERLSDRALDQAGRLERVGGHLPPVDSDVHRVPPSLAENRDVGATNEEIITAIDDAATPFVEAGKQHESNTWSTGERRPAWQDLVVKELRTPPEIPPVTGSGPTGWPAQEPTR